MPNMPNMLPTFRLWTVLRPAPDVPGQWVGHCLDIDVVSQGDSLAHALAMTIEACCMVLNEDVKRGLDPLRRRAPEGDWQEFGALMRNAHPIPGGSPMQLVGGFENHFAALMVCVDFEPNQPNPPEQIPMAWANSDAPPDVMHC